MQKKYFLYIVAPFDPGWNDPPTFNYSNAPPPTKTKLNLNKRIAFPIQASDNSAALPKMEISGAGLPMPFAKVKLNVNDSSATVPVINNVPLQPPPSSMTSLQKPCESVKESNYSSNLSEKLGNSLEPVMDTLREINGALASTDSSKVEEIDKRLKILETMWTDGKIDDKLKILLVNTAKGRVFSIKFSANFVFILLLYSVARQSIFCSNCFTTFNYCRSWIKCVCTMGTRIKAINFIEGK